MKQNQGYTLIELIVVIAVIAVLAFGTVMGSGMLGGYRVQKCVDDIDGALNETLVNAMSREACTLTLSRDADGSYLQMTGRQKEKIADKSITISYGKSGFAGKTKLSFGESLILSYERSSGAFLPIITNIKNEKTGDYVYLPAGDGTNAYCTDITVSMGARSSSTIRLTKETGKHYIE